MKKYVTISLFVFWVLVVAILIAGLISFYNKQQPATGLNPAVTEA